MNLKEYISESYKSNRRVFDLRNDDKEKEYFYDNDGDGDDKKDIISGKIIGSAHKFSRENFDYSKGIQMHKKKSVKNFKKELE